MKSSYEYVILDGPSTEDDAAFGVLAGTSDGVVMVVRNDSDAPARAEKAKNAVIAAGSRVIGAIVNAAPVPAPPTPAERPKAMAMA